MTQQDTDIYKAWQLGSSIGSLAKAYKLDKSQIKKVINRVNKEPRTIASTEVVYELPAAEASSGW